MATIATKLLFIACFLQVSLVFSLHTKEVLQTQDLVYHLNQKTNEYNLKQSMTNVFLISSPEAKRLRAQLGPFYNKPRKENDGLDRIRQKFKFLFQSMDVPQDQLDKIDEIQKEYNEKYAARIARYSRYFLYPKIFFTGE